MRNGEKRLTQQQILWLSFLIAITMVFLVIIFPRLISNNASLPVSPPNVNPPIYEESSPVPTQLIQVLESNTPQVNGTNKEITPQIYFTPQIGAGEFNLPNDFIVGTWHDNSCDISLFPYMVNIYSVEIQGGTPPFEFTFWQGNTVTDQFFATPQNGEIKFSNPIKIWRGPYIHVKITFQSENGPSEWEDDLRYPKNPQCLRP